MNVTRASMSYEHALLLVYLPVAGVLPCTKVASIMVYF